MSDTRTPEEHVYDELTVCMREMIEFFQVKGELATMVMKPGITPMNCIHILSRILSRIDTCSIDDDFALTTYDNGTKLVMEFNYD